MYASRAPVPALLLLACASAQAGVSVQEQMSLDVASLRAHGTTTRRITSDRQRTETEFSCEGFLSMLCGHNGSLEIVRLDRGLIVSGDPGKKTYVEKPLPTPDQRRALEERMRAAAEKLKSCPRPAHPEIDTSKCRMSAPVVNLTRTDDVASIAGHDARHSIITMTQSCTNPDTSDSCDMAYTFDVWTANEDLPGTADLRAFQRNLRHRLGLDETAAAALPGPVGQILAPYRDALRRLGDQSSELKGYPLKTAFRVAISGSHCAAATGVHGNAAAVAAASKLLGGLFGKKKPAGAPAPKPAEAPAASTAPAAPAAPTAPAATGTSGSSSTSAAAAAAPEAPAAPAMKTIAEFSVVTTSIDTGAIPPDQFEMPADWQKLPPKEQAPPEVPDCPKTGS